LVTTKGKNASIECFITMHEWAKAKIMKKIKVKKQDQDFLSILLSETQKKCMLNWKAMS